MSHIWNFAENSRRKGNSNSCGAVLANAGLVAANDRPVDTTSNNITQHKDNSLLPQQPRPNLSLVSSTPSNSLPLVWRSLQDQGILTAASDIIVRAWRHGTIKQYKPYLCKAWFPYGRECVVTVS